MAQVIWNSDIDVYDPKVIPYSIASTIAGYLSVQDLISFEKVSRNTYKAVNNPHLWISKLHILGVWKEGSDTIEKIEREKADLSHMSNPLTCLDGCIRSSKMAKLQVLKIYRSLSVYYNDLLVDKPYNKLKIFKDFQTPEDQARILTNLLKFNSIDFYEESRDMARDKIDALFEIFENALLRELDIHYDLEDYDIARRFVLILIELNNEQTLIDFFLQKSIFDNEDKLLFNLEIFNGNIFFREPAEDDSNTSKLNEEEFNKLIKELADAFNQESEIIDIIFPSQIPMMYKVSEEFISNQFVELIMSLIETSKQKGAYLDLVPYLYEKLTIDFIKELKESKNIGVSYFNLVKELIDMSCESFIAEYIREESSAFRSFTNENIMSWNKLIKKRETETSESILKHVKTETKNDFLTSFKKVFTINANNNKNDDISDENNYSEMQAKAHILSENIRSLNKIFSPELIITILNETKISLHRLLKFKEFTIVALRKDVFSTMQEIFIDVLESISNDHLRPGFTKALTYLQTYNPKEVVLPSSESSLIGPLVMFFELINMADLIIQMLDIFYKEEILNRRIVKHENSVLNPSIQNKKKVEGMVDTYVADGLNIGIEILVHELETVFKNDLKDSDYDPPLNTDSFGTTEAARKVVNILDQNIDLLVDSAEKSIVDVFQQEIAERFFQTIVKTLKRSTISVIGATNLISDLNLYYDFIMKHIKTNRKNILPLFQALKKVGNIYLISGDDSKAIGKLVSDLSKFNGIFGQEEIYEFVQRRKDWLVVKKEVEKVMYGFGLGDCTII